MKKAFIIIACVAAMLAAGTSLKAQEVTITLMPGWTWISIPSTETMDFAAALGSFTPAVGDRIKSQWGNATYRGNGEWRGQISEFYPGYGYKYYSTRQVPVSVTFNAQQPSQQVVVTTDTPQFITGNSAMGGGEVTVSDGTYILVRGLCWATHENPTTNDDNFLEEGSGVGSFSATMTGLNWSTTYYYRAYAVTPRGTVYGEQQSFTTRDGIPTLTTTDITNITAISATSGGNITDNGGLNITARGVCWSTSPNPTVSDSHTTDGTGTGSFTSTITGLNASTTYYVRAYASNSLVTIYGGEQSFTTEAGGGSGGDHAYVDLGLPSGTLWATCNVGANSPEDYGNHFAWGETQPKNNYYWNTYQYCNGGDGWNTLTKYCSNFSYGYNGFTDNLTYLQSSDDVATVNWGEDWRMPTKEEWQELHNNTICTWVTQNSVNGRLFTASNGNSIFIPAAGYGDLNGPNAAGNMGDYWSRTLNPSFPYYAYGFYFDSGGFSVYDSYRCGGLCVRPVRSQPQGAIIGLFSVSDTRKVYFSQGNLQYQASSNTWRFAENQWDYVGTHTPENNEPIGGTVVGSDNHNISSTYSGWIDLFGWGTSSYHDSNDPYNVNYQPWSTSWSTVDEYYNYYGYGPSTNMSSPNLTGSSANYDWGIYNPITNGGNTSNQWRTLTQSEWSYVFFDRATISGIRYAKAKVNNVNGIILLPDNWSNSIYSLSDTNTEDASFNSNILTISEWNIIEDAGAVFLPAAGARSETWIYSVGSVGFYWSTSYYNSESGCDVIFGDNFINNSYSGRIGGLSVRLVSTFENIITKTITVTSNPMEGGSVSGGGTYQQGQSCMVSATATAGYTFTNWTENGSVVSTNANYTFTVNSNRTLVANFSAQAPNIYTISVSSNPTNGGSVTGGGTYQQGQSCTVTAIAASGYTFLRWTENGNQVSTNANYTFSVTSNRSLMASFTQNGSAPPGAINGLFSVSDNQQVYFSRGNLQYQASTNTWRFATNQYDYVGSANSSISSTNSGWIDLFGWGTSGYNHGAVCYQPWSTSTNFRDYYAYGNYQYNLCDQTGQADWGYNPISNGGNATDQWRTLTQPEWDYVFNTRVTTSGIRYAMANVNNVNGVILLPDDWNTSIYSLSTTNSSEASFSSNTLTASQWNTLEQAGAVFLPAAGFRGGTSVIFVGSYGCYWSASFYYSNGAYNMYFGDSYLYTGDYYRYRGRSVRLVAPAEN